MFSAPTTTDTEPKSLGNINADDLNSNQQIVPVAYLAGRRIIAGQSLTPVYNLVTKAEKRQTVKGGKGGGSGNATQIDYGDFGLAFCMGGRQPAEAVFKIIVNADIVWQSDDGVWFGAAEYVDITVVNYGLVRIYKGSFTQPVDSFLTPRGTIPSTPGFDPRLPQTWPYRDPESGETTYLGLPSGETVPISGHYEDHSAYRPICYGIFRNWRLGRNPAPAPNIKVEMQRSVPWFAGSSADRAATGLDADATGVNPIGVGYDILTDPVFGLGRSDAALRQAGWEAALTAESWLRIAPLLTNFSTAKTILANLISPWSTEVKSYVDGFLRERDGLLDIGVFDHGLIDTNALPLLTDDDLDGDPDLLPTSYDDVQTTFFASYSDKDHYYQKRAQKYDDPSARRQVGEERRVIDERDWITDGAIAKRWVTEAGRIRILPGQSGPIPVKREWLDNAPAVGGGTYGQVREGDRFVWNSASLGLTQLLWIGETEWPEDRSGQTTLHVENERGYWPSNYIPPADTSLGDYVIKPVEIVTHRILELPSGELKTSNTREIAVLALRTDAAMRGFHVHTSVDNSSFVLASEHNHFAVFGKIKTADYVATTPVVDTTVGMVVDLYGADLDQLTPQSNQQRDDNAWLAICGNEILSVGDVVALGSGRYRVYFRRGLYGTAIANHAIDTDVWFIPRANITPIANANFINGATRYFKLQPYTQTHELDLAGVTSFAFTFGTGPFVLSGLELAGQGNDFVFIGRNPKFAWRLYSIFGAEISGQQLSLGAYDDQFAQFNLRVRDAESGDVVWTGSSKVPEYVFDYEQNALCVDGPRREFYFAVAALSRSGEQTPWEEIEVNNPNETFDQAGSVGGGINAIDFLLSPSTALDHAGCILWRSLDPDFEVDPEEDWSVVGAVHAGVELVFKGPDNFFSVPQDEGTTYYYRVAAYDDFWNGDIADLIIGAAVAQFTMDTSRPPPAVSPGSHSFTDPFVASMTADEGLVVRYRLDGTEATIGAIEWPKVDGVYTTLPISETCILRVRGFDANGVPTKELIIFYTKVASGGGGVERCGAVSIHFSGRQGYTAGTIILTAATPGGTIHKSVNGAAYSDYTAPFVLNLDEIVEAYESAPGLVDGPVSSFDNPDPT